MKGFITFYVNFFPEINQDIQSTLDFFAKYNKETIDKIKEYGYEVLFLATTKESSRIEKLDLDLPFPRYVQGMRKVSDIEEPDE